MRLLHVADLHLGKSLHRFSLHEDQRYILKQILEIADRERVDALLVAGDLFDRGIPPLDAVSLFDEFLTRARGNGLMVYAISGNHDSSVRLSYASRLLRNSGCHIVSRFKADLDTEVLDIGGESLRIYLLPYVRASQLRNLYESPDRSFHELMNRYLDENVIDEARPSLLLAHQWVAGCGGKGLESDSEVPAVGQVETLDASIFERFSHVALGHLHRPQQTGKTIQYSGSPLAYSASEAGQEKSVTLIDQKGGKLEWRRVTLQPLRRLITIKGVFENILDDDEMSACDDYVYVELEDEILPAQAMLRLQGKFPYLCSIRFNRYRLAAEQREQDLAAGMREDTLSLFREFFEQESGHSILPQQEKILTRLLDRREE